MATRLAEWLYESGIGEARAALVEDGRIAEALIEVEGSGPFAGTVADARLTEILIPQRRGVASLDDGTQLLVEPLGRGWTQGGMVRVEIVREAISEPGNPKRAVARPAPDKDATPGLPLRARLATGALPVVDVPAHGPDALEAAGWSETIEAAQSRAVAFDGGLLRIEPTAAMTLIDVDGHLPRDALAVAAAGAAARAIRLFGIAGSIGVDFPSVEGKAQRLAVAAAFDAMLPPPFERTALNGFGFMQIVRPRTRQSLIEQLRADPVGHAARALLRSGQRSGIVGAARLVGAPPVIGVIAARPDWIAGLGRALGGAVGLRSDAALTISGGYVEKP